MYPLYKATSLHYVSFAGSFRKTPTGGVFQTLKITRHGIRNL